VGLHRFRYGSSAHHKPHWKGTTIKSLFVGFEVLTAVVMNSSLFLDITPWNPLKVNQSSACHLRHAGFLLGLLFLPWRWKRHVSPKRQLTFNGLHGVISQKIKLFKSVFMYKHSLLAVNQKLSSYSFNFAKLMHVLVKIFIDFVAYFCLFLKDFANIFSVQC
jgi:hypothetical protein